MTILDALTHIKDNLDESLTFRHSCRMGICGSCGININGKPMLACYTQVLDLDTDSILLEPLPNMPVIRDLVVDIQKFFGTFRDIKTTLIISPEELQKNAEFNQMPVDLKKFWDLSLCIKCSICYSACPAAIDEKFLGPAALTTNYRFIVDSRDQGSLERLNPMADNIWLCTQCNSCTIFCPKEVECANALLEDHSLLVETGKIPRIVKDVLESVYKYRNPMGIHQSRRTDWAEDLNVKTFPMVSKADVLLFVCCSNAYDPRNQKITRHMVQMLTRLSVDFEILGVEEWCCGDHMFRLGEKGLFGELAEHNVSIFKQLNPNMILTLSPHCYNTFKNDAFYKDAGLKVEHYTVFLAKALRQGRIKLTKPIKKRVAYHDPCFLGKRNGVYDEPRQILRSIDALELVELKRSRQNSFCCGGGAGRVWTEEAQPEKRPSVDRVREALELGVDVIAVACPYCLTSLEDAIKVLEAEDKIAVKDILEILVEAT